MTRKMGHKSILILFCAMQVYQIPNVSSSKTNPFEMEDFINQLMSSKKFSELTDIIAEKAAKKMKSFQKDKKEHSSKKEYRNTDDTQNETAETMKENENLKARKGVSTTKFGKINTDAFLKQDLKSGELMLNYKHMTAELKRSNHKTNTQKNGDNLDRDRGTRSDKDSKMNRDKHSEKPKYQSKERKIQPRKQLKTNKLYEEIERSFNKMNRSINQDSSSSEINYKNVNNTTREEASEEHEIFIKTDVDVVPKLNVKKAPNSIEKFDKYEKNEVDTKSIKNPTNSDDNIEKITKAVKIPVISNKELDERDKSIKNHERPSKTEKEYHEFINDQENTNTKVEKNAQVMESSENSIRAKHENLNKTSPNYYNENSKKNSKTIKYQENTNKKFEISPTPIQDLIEKQNRTKLQKINLKKIGNMQTKRPKLQKGTPKFRTEKSITTTKADHTTEHLEDYSDVLNFGGAKDTLLKEPILKMPYPIVRRENGRIYTQNYSEPDYKEYYDKVSKGNIINI